MRIKILKKILAILLLSNFLFVSIIYAGAFHEYIYKCDMESVKKFVAAGVDINGTVEDIGSSPLSSATSASCGVGPQADTKKYNLIKYLIDNGAVVTKCDYVDCDFFGCHECNTKAIQCYELFKNKGMDISSITEFGKNALFTIISDIWHDSGLSFKTKSDVNRKISIKLPAIKYLLKEGVDVNIIVDCGDYGKKSMLDLAFDIGNFELINLLKKYDAKKRVDIEVDNINSE